MGHPFRPLEEEIRLRLAAMDEPGCEGFFELFADLTALRNAALDLRAALDGAHGKDFGRCFDHHFEKLYPLALAWHNAGARIEPVYESRLKPRYLLFRLLFDISTQASCALPRRLEALEAYLQVKPTSDSAQLVKAEILMDLDRSEEAMELLEKMLAGNSMRLFQSRMLRKLLENHPGMHIQKGSLGDLNRRFCSAPFEQCYLSGDGMVWICCPAFVPVPLGNLHENTFLELWNNPIAQELRRSILDGDFQYCNPLQCVKMGSDALPLKSEVANAVHQQIIRDHALTTPGPRHFYLAEDPTCNLACPQCRVNSVIPSAKTKAWLDAILESDIQSILDYARENECTLLLSGNGDPFASPHYMKILQRLDPAAHRGVTLRLLTNGLLFKKAWESLPNIHGLLRHGYVDVSIDAASPEVYCQVRGGNWQHLLESLHLISELRREGVIGTFLGSFTIQTCNFLDMKPAAEMAKQLGMDRMKFNQLRNQLTYAEEDYRQRTVFRPGHPRFHEFLAEMADPIFREPFIDFGALKWVLKSPGQ